MDVTERVIAIINYLAVDEETRGITEICNKLAISKSTVFRIVSSLEKLQWVERDPKTKKYRIGSRPLEIGLAFLSKLDIRSICLPYLTQLTNNTHETAMLSLKVGLERVYVERVEGSYEFRIIPALGMRHPLWCGAGGKAILAYLDENESEMVLEDLEKSGWRYPGSEKEILMDDLSRELADIKRRGFAISFGERVPGAAAVAAPIFRRDQSIAGSITIAGNIHRFTDQVIKDYGALITQAARDINLRLGSIRDHECPDHKLMGYPGPLT